MTPYQRENLYRLLLTRIQENDTIIQLILDECQDFESEHDLNPGEFLPEEFIQVF